jgi:hypothetical protein
VKRSEAALRSTALHTAGGKRCLEQESIAKLVVAEA